MKRRSRLEHRNDATEQKSETGKNADCDRRNNNSGPNVPLPDWRRSRSVTEDVRSRMIEFLPRLRRFAYTLTRNSDQADDLVQDTCERALARIELWKPGTKLESWMYQIARNLWVDRGRAARVRGEVADLDTVLNIADSDGRTVTENRLMVSRVLECMGRLTHDQQVLLALVCVEGLTYPEAAEILGIPIGTVMSRLARARQAVGAAILDKSDTMRSAEARGGKRS